jgi:hypothetical protein
MRLSRAILRILETEAACFGWARSQFLDALVWHKTGHGVRLERLPTAPRKYRFSEEDWTTNERWIWYVGPETKKRFDDLRRTAGNILPAAWITLAASEWVGLPTGSGGGRQY